MISSTQVIILVASLAVIAGLGYAIVHDPPTPGRDERDLKKADPGDCRHSILLQGQVEGGRTVYTVNHLPDGPSYAIDTLHWRMIEGEDTIQGPFSEAAASNGTSRGSLIIRYVDQVAPANQLNLGDQIIVEKPVTEHPLDIVDVGGQYVGGSLYCY